MPTKKNSKVLTENDLIRMLEEKRIRGYTLTSKAPVPVTSKNKYNSKKVLIDGKWFDSKKEGSRYLILRMMELAGLITELETQVVYVLIEKNGKERQLTFRADFRYKENGVLVVEDVKGVKTRTYINKRKLMLEKFGIAIRET